jgi:hypothetical protein
MEKGKEPDEEDKKIVFPLLLSLFFGGFVLFLSLFLDLYFYHSIFFTLKEVEPLRV